MKKNVKYIAPILLLIGNAAIAQSAATRGMSYDSTNIIPESMAPAPVINYIQATTYNAPGTITSKGSCGPSANSILPSAPNSFLCATGTPSSVSTSGSNYYWSCTGNSSDAANIASCQAQQRVIAVCGSDNGKTLASTPTNLCSVGTASAVSQSSSTYTWSCNANYGPMACGANRQSGCTDFAPGSSFVGFTYTEFVTNLNLALNINLPLVISEGSITERAAGSTSNGESTYKYICTGGAWQNLGTGSWREYGIEPPTFGQGMFF